MADATAAAVVVKLKPTPSLSPLGGQMLILAGFDSRSVNMFRLSRAIFIADASWGSVTVILWSRSCPNIHVHVPIDTAAL
jgi:hypothetical protein